MRQAPRLPFRPTPHTYGLSSQNKVGVQVKLIHIANPAGLELSDRQNLDEMVNPITGEDYRAEQKDGPVCAHNLWIQNTEPAAEHHFLAVIYPYRQSIDPEPAITRVDDWTVQVESEPGVVDQIHFGAQPTAGTTLTVDHAAIAAGCCPDLVGP